MFSKPDIQRLLKALFIKLPLFLFVSSVLYTLALRWLPVYYTPLMAIRYVQNSNNADYRFSRHWRDLKEISPNMARAVLAAEDARFQEHHGFDFVEIRKALRDSAHGKKLRGASTISQQTAKNVFLAPGRSWVRKGLEGYFTVLIELLWGKERILEVYLNVAEMGPGIFGAEAAAERLFQTRSAKLTRNQCSLIAATLPNPWIMKADRPSRYVRMRARHILEESKNISVSEFFE